MEHLQEEKEKMLWKQAKKRVGFKNHLYTYIGVNGFFWLLWALTGKGSNEDGIPWPTFCTLGWGFGLFWHFLGAFVMHKGPSQVEKEFERLKNKQN